ncbi:MAG: CBS domain-containing protein [Candidatus Bathyarchaeia archaeon]
MIQIKDLMSSPVTTIGPSKTAYDAARIMNDRRVSGLAVVDEDGNPVGVVTEKDLARKIIAERLDPVAVKVGDIMSKPPITISSNHPIEDAVRLMAKNKIKRLPVVEGDMLVGIITVTDLTRYIDYLDRIRPSMVLSYG